MNRTRVLCVAACLLALSTLSYAQGTSPPKIMDQSPSFYVVLPKEPVEIKCKAEGSPAPTYHWQKNGAEIEMTGVYSLNEGNLMVRRPSEMTNGIYRCFATNSYGVDMSNKIDFQIAFTDAFEDKVKITYAFNQGDVATVPCNQPDSVPAPSIFWTDDANPGNKIPLDNRVSIDPNFNLRFSNINLTDIGSYQCNVKNDKLRIQLLSPVKEIVVIPVDNIDPRPATLVYTPPAAVDAFRTEKLHLKCMAEGYPTPAITWAKDGESLPADRTTYESYNQELVISDINAADVGAYTCTASNGGGTPTSFTVTVTVQSTPYWENKPEDTTIVINDEGMLDCEANGIPIPMVTWLINGVAYQEADPNPRRTVTEGTGGGRVVIKNAITEDSAVFVCVASNEHGEIFASAFLNVESIPAEMSDAPTRNLNSIEGKSFDLTCAGQGSPKPNIQWTFQNNPIVDGESKYSIVEDGNTKSTTSTLMVTGVAVEDSGDYKCIIENGFGEVAATSTLNVRRGTTIVVGPGPEVSVELDEEAIIACEVDHDVTLEPKVTWSRNLGDGEVELDLSMQGGRFRKAKTGSDNLKVLNTVVEDTGTYTCKAVTSEDEALASTELVIKTVPTSPSQPIVRKRSDVSDTMVAVEWASGDDGNSPITQYIVSYMTEFPDLGWQVMKTVTAPSLQASLNLSPYVTYRFRVVAINDIGPSRPSELSDEYSTAAEAFSESPENVELEATDPGKLKVTWPEVHPYDQNGPEFKYVIRWREPGTETWETKEITDYQTTSLEIDGGDNYKELEVQVEYRNALGPGLPSDKSGFTGEGTPTQAPQNVKVSAENPTEVIITWDEVPASSFNGMLEKFMIYFTMVEAQAQGQKPAECLPHADCRVGNLSPYMTYEFQVAVRNGQHEGEKSAPVTFKMPEGESGPVFGMSLVPLSYRILVKWGKPASPNGIITGYNLTYTPYKGSDLGDKTKVAIDNPEANSYKLESAQPDTKYRISVNAANGFGLGQENTMEAKTRLAGAPPKPLLADAQIAPGKTYINVTFVQNKEGAAAGNFFVLYRKRSEEDEAFEETKPMDLLDGNMTTVPGLTPSTEYTLQIVAVNDQAQTTGDLQTAKTITDAARTADPVYVQAWFIALLIIIVALLCILLVLCILKSQRGGKYNVSDKEQQRKGDIESTPLKDDDGFEEFEPRKDNPDGELPRGSQGSLQDSEPGSSDTDSLKEYADGELGKFNEEGSFIGQYGDKKQRPTDDTDQGGAAYSTFV